MPVVAVGAAVWGGMALAGPAVLGTWATVAAIGAVATGVGVVTGNKSLMTIGSVMGIAGGVGGLASGAGMFGNAADPLGSNEFGGATASSDAAAATTPAQGAVAQQAAATIDTGAVDTFTGAPTGVIDTPAASAGATAPAPTGGLIDRVSATAVDSTQFGSSMTALESAAGQVTPDNSLFDKIMQFGQPMKQWAEKNQLLAFGILKVGGDALGGLFTDTSKKDALMASQAAYYDVNALKTAQETANMAAPLPGIINSGQPRPPAYRTGALAYTPPSILNSVTGRPA